MTNRHKLIVDGDVEAAVGGASDGYGTAGKGGHIAGDNKGNSKITFGKNSYVRSGKGGDAATTLGRWGNSGKGHGDKFWVPSKKAAAQGHGGDGGAIGSGNKGNIIQKFNGRVVAGAGGAGKSGKGGAGGSIGCGNS